MLNKSSFQLDGNNELLICGYNSILDYNTSNVKISAIGITVTIAGNGLLICFMDKNSVMIKGNIISINFTKVN